MDRFELMGSTNPESGSPVRAMAFDSSGEFLLTATADVVRAFLSIRNAVTNACIDWSTPIPNMIGFFYIICSNSLQYLNQIAPFISQASLSLPINIYTGCPLVHNTRCVPGPGKTTKCLTPPKEGKEGVASAAWPASGAALCPLDCPRASTASMGLVLLGLG